MRFKGGAATALGLVSITVRGNARMDIEELKKLEKQLIVTEKKARFVFDQIPEMAKAAMPVLANAGRDLIGEIEYAKTLCVHLGGVYEHQK